MGIFLFFSFLQSIIRDIDHLDLYKRLTLEARSPPWQTEPYLALAPFPNPNPCAVATVFINASRRVPLYEPITVTRCLVDPQHNL
jgi:hypothetical protein